MAKVSKNMEIPICSNCSKAFDENEFFSFKNGCYIEYCSDCCEELVLNENRELDIENFKTLLRKIDKAFFYSLWKEIQSLGYGYFEEYLKLLEKNKLQNKRYKDSDNLENNSDLKQDNEGFSKWGVNKTEDVEFLENEYHEWETSYEIDSKAMVDSVMQLCLIDLDIRKARQKSDVTSLDKLLRIKSQILGDANLKPVQETGNAANEQVSIGMLIKKFEQERPVPEIEEPDWIDEMKVWIVGQLARMEGLQSDVTDDFNKELEEYGVNIEELGIKDGGV